MSLQTAEQFEENDNIHKLLKNIKNFMKEILKT